ncbi:hypothetical protein TALC_01099 [Thermoplasmatales archaeon BRNA1]|nr:hypothetical protein TALC_01099 [Thermoplasmatales archaeon BRNA1]
MIIGAPLKFRILELVDKKPMWNYEIVDILKGEYNLDSAIGRDNINYDCIETVSAGFCKEIEWDIDTDGSRFDSKHPGRLLTKYEITPYGRDTLNELKAKVRCYVPDE